MGLHSHHSTKDVSSQLEPKNKTHNFLFGTDEGIGSTRSENHFYLFQSLAEA